MSERPDGRPERRRHPRISTKGAITFQTLDLEQRGRIANISEGGMFVQTNVGAPNRLLARTVDLEIRLDAGQAEWLRATGRIVRLAPAGLAISFDIPPPGFLRMIDEVMTASRARARIISVVLIDGDEERRSAMAAGFRSTGCTVIEASTPLEAIVRLGESSFEPDAIALAASCPSNEAQQMREFIERDHPNVKLITIGDDVLNLDGLANWLSSANPEADLPARVRDALVAPHKRR